MARESERLDRVLFAPLRAPKGPQGYATILTDSTFKDFLSHPEADLPLLVRNICLLLE